MGLGDQLIATGLARGAQQRGKRIAFGDGVKIRWDHNSPDIFRDNPNIAPPGSEGARDLEWIGYYKGRRGYNRQGNGRWEWNMNWRCKPGEVFFTAPEKTQGARHGSGFIVIEPNVPAHKTAVHNKQWPVDRFQKVADLLRRDGHRLLQPFYKNARYMLHGVERVTTISFRDMLAVMANASLYIGPEGGLHHGAAAVGKNAVVLFGGFIPPRVTGYDMHTNLTGGVDKACGMFSPCEHCQRAMDAISVDDVYEAARAYL